MKKILLLLLPLLGVALTNAPVAVLFVWNQPTDQPYTNVTYKIYGTTNLTAPTNQWPLVTVATNPLPIGASQLSFPIAIQPGAWFFFMTSSNFWGESPGSNVAATPPLPQLQNLIITR